MSFSNHKPYFPPSLPGFPTLVNGPNAPSPEMREHTLIPLSPWFLHLSWHPCPLQATSFIFPISDSSSPLWWPSDPLVTCPGSKMQKPELDFKSGESIKTCVLNCLPALPLLKERVIPTNFAPLPVLSIKDFLRVSTVMFYLYPILSHCQLESDNHKTVYQIHQFLLISLMFKFLFAHGDTHSRVGAKDFLQALVCLINAIFEGGVMMKI